MNTFDVSYTVELRNNGSKSNENPTITEDYLRSQNCSPPFFLTKSAKNDSRYNRNPTVTENYAGPWVDISSANNRFCFWL